MKTISKEEAIERFKKGEEVYEIWEYNIDEQNFFQQFSMKEDVKKSGEFIITAQDCLDTVGYIPGNLLVPKEHFEVEYDPKECEFIYITEEKES